MALITKRTNYYLIYLYEVFKLYIHGFLVKYNQLCLFINPCNISTLCLFLRYNSILSFSSLVDVVVVDYPNRYPYRFEVNYFFLSYV